MTTANLFQWVTLNQDVPNTPIQKGDRGVVVDHLPANAHQSEPGYLVELFKDGETLDVIAVPISWTTPLPQFWGKSKEKGQQTQLS